MLQRAECSTQCPAARSQCAVPVGVSNRELRLKVQVEVCGEGGGWVNSPWHRSGTAPSQLCSDCSLDCSLHLKRHWSLPQ